MSTSFKVPSKIKVTLSDLSKMIDHSLLHPTMTDKDAQDGLDICVKYNVGAACIKPYFTKTASMFLNSEKNSNLNIQTCAVIGFPAGNSSIDIKVAETVQVVADGATEVDMVVNIGKVLAGDYDYIHEEISRINTAATKNGGLLKVIFENDYLQEEHIRRLCEICKQVNVGFAKTSTGYGFKKDADGKYSYDGATEKDLLIMREVLEGTNVRIKAAGGVRTLDDLLRVRALGVSRIGATATAAIMKSAAERGIGNDPVEVKVTAHKLGGGGY